MTSAERDLVSLKLAASPSYPASPGVVCRTQGGDVDRPRLGAAGLRVMN